MRLNTKGPNNNNNSRPAGHNMKANKAPLATAELFIVKAAVACFCHIHLCKFRLSYFELARNMQPKLKGGTWAWTQKTRKLACLLLVLFSPNFALLLPS